MTKDRRKKYEMDMCNGPILRKMLMFAIPLICSSVLQLLFNAADVIVVGRFAGDNSLAAVGSTSSLINLLVNFFMGLSIAANVLVARYYASKQEQHLFETVHTAIALSVISGMILTVVGLVATPTLLRWMQTPEEIIDLAVIYLRVYFVGITAMMVYNFGAAILRAIGDTRRPLYFLLIAGVINVSFNLFFVIVLKWGVFGVGFATTISQTISATLVVRCLMKEEGGIHLALKELKVYREKFFMILRIGLPASFQSILFSLSNVLIQSSVNSFGATVVAGNSAAANLEGFVYVGMNAFYQSAISFTSQNMGAGKYERINKILFAAQGCVIVVGTILGIGCYTAGPVLLKLYTDSDAVVAAGMVRLSIISVPYALCGIMDVMVGVLRGLGYAVVPMIVSLVGACASRLVWLATVFQIERYHTIETVYWIYPISWIFTAIVHIICYLIIRRKILSRYTRNI